jgi:ribose transport system ATP-binding protein
MLEEFIGPNSLLGRALSMNGTFAEPGCFNTREVHAAEIGVKCVSVEQRCGELSGGNQQKVALARLMCARSELLLLDEPTRGIDVASKAQIYEWIDALARGAGGTPPKGIVLVSSHIPELLGVCDRIAVMRRGELGPARAVAEWDEASLLAEAMLAGVAR